MSIRLDVGTVGPRLVRAARWAGAVAITGAGVVLLYLVAGLWLVTASASPPVLVGVSAVACLLVVAVVALGAGGAALVAPTARWRACASVLALAMVAAALPALIGAVALFPLAPPALPVPAVR